MGACSSFIPASFAFLIENHNRAKSQSTEALIPERRHVPSPTIPLENLEVDIRKGLRSLTKKPSDRESSKILLPQDVTDFWVPIYNTEFYRRQHWYDPRWDRSRFMQKYLRIMSILILSKFKDWRNFKEIFIDKGRDDTNLPYTQEDLSRDDFLGPDFAVDFWEKQWIVCPLVIEERMAPYVLTDNEAERRFPYVEKEKRIGFGASCTVYQQVIAAKHLRYNRDGRISINETDKKVACKKVDDDRVEPVEFTNLESLRDCLSKHDRIMVNIATIIRHEENAGRVHLIFYDLAAYDLRHLLSYRVRTPDGKLNHEEDHKKRNDSGPPMRNDSHMHWEGDLIKESQNLADALDFLHNRLYRNGHWSLVHNDLKPENILVFYPDSESPSHRYPVGQWKIADFGLAKIKENQQAKLSKQRPFSPRLSALEDPDKLGVDLTHRRNSTSARSVSITTAKREPGMYSAPEVEGIGKAQPAARANDIWAFGCILSEVLAYAIAPPLVKELHNVCDNDLDQRYYDTNTKRLKCGFNTWLHELPCRCKGEPDPPKWVSDCVALIDTILVVDPSGRRKADAIRDELRRIAKYMKRDDKWTFMDLPVSKTSPATSNAIQIAVVSPPIPGSGSSEQQESPTSLSPKTKVRPNPIAEAITSHEGQNRL